jgi:hypothetical protein
MSTIGSLVVNLGLASASFSSGLKSAQSSLGKFQSSVKSFATSTTGILTGVAGAFGVALGANAMKNFIGDQMEAIDQTAKLSDSLGITTERLVGLQHAASLSGVSIEDFGHDLQMMNKAIGEALAGGGGHGGGNPFEKIGLDAHHLASMDAGSAFTEIAEGISRLPTAAERASTAFAIFHKKGISLLPMLQMGKEGLAAAQVEAERLGLTFSRVDAAKVEQANDAMTRLSAVFTGIGRTLAIELAPYIEAIAVKLMEWMTAGDGIRRSLGTALEYIVLIVGKGIDTLNVFKMAWYGVKAATLMFASMGVSAMASVGRAIQYAVDMLGSWVKKAATISPALATLVATSDALTSNGFDPAVLDSMAASLEASAGAAANDAVQAFNDVANESGTKGLQSWMSDVKAKADEAAKALADAAPKMSAPLEAVNESAEKISKTLADMKLNLDTFGMTAGGKQLFDLKAMGADPAQLAQAESYLQQLDALTAQKKMADDASELAKSVMMPTQVYQGELFKLDQMLEAGAISYQTYLQGIAQAQDSLRQSSGIDGKTQLSQLKEQRFSFTYRAEKQGGDAVLDVNKLQLAENKKSGRSLANIEAKLTSGPVFAMAEIED